MRKYVNNFLKHNKSLEYLMELYMKILDLEFISLLIENNSSLHILKILHLNISNPILIYSISEIPSKIKISNKGSIIGIVSQNFSISNMILIPLLENKTNLGVIILGNKKTPFELKDVDKIKSVLNLTKLLLIKKQYFISKKNDLTIKKEIETKDVDTRELFLANMSHEIRTPLNGIIGYNQLMNKTTLTTIQKNYLLSMNQCCSQLLQIINDVLDYTKLTSENMSFCDECFTIKEIIDSLWNIISIKINEKEQKFTYEISSEIPSFIVTDKNKLLQILINLLTNAIKFTQSGGKIHLDIRCKNKYLIFQVIDNGPGISKKNQELLFNVFTQLNNALNKMGTGLGLAITKKLVELLGGNIWIQSEEGSGANFSFTILFKEKRDIEELIKNGISILKNKYVLIVDDNHNNRLIIAEFLFEWNMKPISCGSSVEALRYLQSKTFKFELCLLDIIMPDNISGIELSKLIKEEYPYMPTIALSSSDSIIDMTYFNYRINKPIKKLKLFNVIHKIFNKQSINNTILGKPEDISINEKNDSFSDNKNIEILIAEDVIYNTNLLVSMLEIIGFNKIDTCCNGKVCVDKINERKNKKMYDLLLLDLKMPIMNGYDVMDYINKEKIDIKVIAVTASVLENEKAKCTEAGVKYFISKPIDIGILREVIIHAIS